MYRAKDITGSVKAAGSGSDVSQEEWAIERIVEETKMGILAPHPTLLIQLSAGFKAQLHL